MNSFIKDVIKANHEIYEYINTHISKDDYAFSKKIGFGGDESLNIDFFAERIFIKYLSKYGDIFSEESGMLSSKSSYKIIIDPLDGSDNFASNTAYYGTSVALQYQNKTIAGCVCNLVNARMTYKYENSKVYTVCIETLKNIEEISLNNQKMAVVERAYIKPKICEKLYENKIKFRSLGAIALSLVNSNNYQFVLFLGALRSFDIEAALYICSDLNVYQGSDFLIVAKNKYNLELIKDIINKL